MTYKLFKEPSFSIVKSEFDENIGCLVDHAIDLTNFNIHSFDGIGVTRSKLLTSEIPREDLQDQSLDSIANANGEWTAIADRASNGQMEYLFFADRFGYSPIFYSVANKAQMVISSSFQGVIAGLESINVTRSLDIVHYAALIGSNTPNFQNTYSHSTMANEVKMLPAENALLIDTRGAHLINRDLLGNIQNIRSYESAITLGIEHSLDILRVASSIPNVSRRITLTGGVDSRLCASLMVASGTIESFGVSTIDPRTWKSPTGKETLTKDIVVSNSIRDEYNLSWWQMAPRQQVSHGFMESLTCFQSYRSNLAFTFKPSSMHTRFRDPVLTVRGGGGEIIRTDSSIEKISIDFEATKSDDENELLEESSWYAERFLSGSVLRGALRKLVVQSIAEDFPTEYGSSFLERMSKMYLDFRYRGHFGHQRQTTSANDLILHPLSNPYFLKASRMLDFQDLSNGEMVRDIFNQTAPEMLDFPFITDQWTSLLQAGARGPNDYGSTKWMDSLDSSVSRSKAYFDIGHEPGERGEDSNFESRQACLEYIRFAFSRIESTLDATNLPLIAELHGAVLSRVYAGKFIDGYVVAKAASALDVFYPLAVTGVKNAFSCVSESKVRTELSQVPVVEINIPHLPQDGYHNAVFSGFKVKLAKNEDGLIATVRAAGYSGDPVEFAYYLYKNGKRIGVRWYSTSDTGIFIGSDFSGGGDFHVDAFVRTREYEIRVALISSNHIVNR